MFVPQVSDISNLMCMCCQLSSAESKGWWFSSQQNETQEHGKHGIG